VEKIKNAENKGFSQGVTLRQSKNEGGGKKSMPRRGITLAHLFQREKAHYSMRAVVWRPSPARTEDLAVSPAPYPIALSAKMIGQRKQHAPNRTHDDSGRAGVAGRILRPNFLIQ